MENGLGPYMYAFTTTYVIIESLWPKYWIYLKCLTNKHIIWNMWYIYCIVKDESW